MKRIHDSLIQVFKHNRLVLWYDATGEWVEAFESFAEGDVTKLRVAGNEFGTKVRLVRERDTAAKFLIYVSNSRPADARNWLLDIVLQGYEFKADKASLALHEAGLRPEFLSLAEEHAAFFRSEKRTLALKERVSEADQAREVRLKMMAVLADTDDEVDALLLQFLGSALSGSTMQMFDPVVECLDKIGLTEPFWREVGRVFGYSSAAPSLKDFAVTLFRGANPVDTQVPPHAHAKVFLRRWKDSQTHSSSFRDWALMMEREMQVEGALERAEGRVNLGEVDTFEIFEKFSLHRLCQAFDRGAGSTELRAAIKQRRTSFWYPAYRHGYAALEQAVEMRELLASAELSVDSMLTGINCYIANWWRIDMAYRLCRMHLREYAQLNLMKQISAWVEKTYVNNFLLPLADRWCDQLRGLPTWECEALRAQRSFFDIYVRPVLGRGQKLFVIVSDGLRFEAAADFAQRLRSANRWTAELSAILGQLPSYTQLGMASLLPGRQWSIDPATSYASVDGLSATGTPNRAAILRLTCGERATAIQAEDFLELNSKTDGRALMRDHDVIYIFHNQIDDVADTRKTEKKTVDAVEDAFDQLDQIIRKVANINGSNMILTADHGFLFQQEDVDKGDMATLPEAQEWKFQGQRFAIGKGIAEDPGIKMFSADSLGLNGDWSVAFPLSLGRFPRPGSGKRYVHGGLSLQEVIVPVLRIHKARTDDTGWVEVDLLRVPAKITTGQLSIALFQDRPAIEKVLPRTLRIGVYGLDGTSISEIKTVTFDSKDGEARNRETALVLTLSHASDEFNGQEVELRFDEKVQGSEQYITYRAHNLKLQKPFASDFDEF